MQVQFTCTFCGNTKLLDYFRIKGRKYCSRKCRDAAITEPIKQRFEKHFIPEPMSGCWLWIGAYMGTNRYGAFSWKGGVIVAHKASWIIYVGRVPKEMDVCHKCDTNMCVNPRHLFLGTRTDNMQDCVRKGRHAFGEKHGMAKLTVQQVKAIREDLRDKSKIAEEYGISSREISDIKLRRRWKHI